MIKRLFLDIDGVLNTKSWNKKDVPADPVERRKWELTFFDSEKINLINSLSSDVEIVWTSSWRQHEDFQDILREVGIKLSHFRKTNPVYKNNPLNRCYAIHEYLIWNEVDLLTQDEDNKPKIVILDDMLLYKIYKEQYKESFCMSRLNMKFFKTDPKVGLTEEILIKIKNLFEGIPSEASNTLYKAFTNR
jgi:HAD domain in Swiss Army Knife RNA repair proteins